MSAAIGIAQVVRHRRSQRDQFHNPAFRFGLKLIELHIGIDQLARPPKVALHKAAHGFLDRSFGERAHVRDQATKLRQVLVEGLQRMSVRVLHVAPLSRTGR